MSHVTAVLEGHDDRQVVAAARALADLLGSGTDQLRTGTGTVDDRAGRTLAALGAEDVAGVAISAGGATCWQVITHVTVPVVVVPRAEKRRIRGISRVLLPLDGSVEAAVGVAGIAERAVDVGADVTAVHVFEPATVPAFWDQPAHSHEAWTREFLRRNLPGAVHLDLRSGRPADEVLAAAERAGVDLIVLGWNQDLAAGRAATVRQALAVGHAPVLLVTTRRGTTSRPGGT